MTSGDNISSFRKKSSRVLNIPGTRISTHNAQLLTSTGISSLDFHLGGGIPVGTVLLIEEDRYQTYSQLLVKYFLSEAITNGHSIHLANGDSYQHNITKELPALSSAKLRGQENTTNDELKIAWRYQQQKNTETFASFCHSYDLSKKMSDEIINEANIKTWSASNNFCIDKSNNKELMDYSYKHLLQTIQSSIDQGGFRITESSSHNNMLRLAVCSIGSPLWSTVDDQGQSIVRFLYVLRSILRTSFAVAVVTVPSTVTEDVLLQSKIRQMTDFVVKLDSFIGSDKKQNPLFKDFDGLIHIDKLPILNSFSYQVPTADLAFKLRRKNFQIELLHLPPDVEEQSDQGLLCGAPSKLLDF